MGYRHGYNNGQGEWMHLTVNEEKPLLEWLLDNVKESRSKVKATLQGRGIKVNGKCVTQFDFPLQPGMKVAVSKSKQNQQAFKNRYVKIVYEDRWIIVVEKNIGILSMAAGHSSLNVKAVLDDYFHKSRQNCRAHVVHRLDRDTSGLMIYAKDIETEQILEHNWHDIVYDRRYVAVVSGEVEEEGGTIANWLKDNKAYVTYSSPVDNGGKYAVTHFPSTFIPRPCSVAFTFERLSFTFSSSHSSRGLSSFTVRCAHSPCPLLYPCLYPIKLF